MKDELEKFLKGSCKWVSDLHFSCRYFLKIAFAKNISQTWSGSFRRYMSELVNVWNSLCQILSWPMILWKVTLQLTINAQNIWWYVVNWIVISISAWNCFRIFGKKGLYQKENMDENSMAIICHYRHERIKPFLPEAPINNLTILAISNASVKCF